MPGVHLASSPEPAEFPSLYGYEAVEELKGLPLGKSRRRLGISDGIRATFSVLGEA
jgi:hypothetical protein